MKNSTSTTDIQIRAHGGRGAGATTGDGSRRSQSSQGLSPRQAKGAACVAPPLARDRTSSSLCGRGPFSDTIQTARLRKASWWTRLTYARRRDWTAERLAAACGFDPRGTAAMAARLGIPLRRA